MNASFSGFAHTSKPMAYTLDTAVGGFWAGRGSEWLSESPRSVLAKRQAIKERDA
ncbi:hypothetical protein [Rhodopila globiformis]|uniref:hypothetical protein n=1 Tax=Rhodopila globiformis TaxID=1071 RepID=UPI0013048FB1|nr:hypothetical protein [Rhodopila globiformis]